jgi:hypothetical protein
MWFSPRSHNRQSFTAAERRWACGSGRQSLILRPPLAAQEDCRVTGTPQDASRHRGTRSTLLTAGVNARVKVIPDTMQAMDAREAITRLTMRPWPSWSSRLTRLRPGPGSGPGIRARSAINRPDHRPTPSFSTARRPSPVPDGLPRLFSAARAQFAGKRHMEG